MIGAYLRRGLVAGLVAGVLAGGVGFVLAEPALDQAVLVEQRAEASADADDPVVSRGQQKAGLVGGYALVGAAMGMLFGVASAWAVGRLDGDGWTRSLKLGAVAAAALVVLPALKYPPNPPGVGDPGNVGQRTALYLALGGIGLLLAAAAWTGARQFGARATRAVRQVVIGSGVVAACAVILAVLPSVSSAAEGFPAELLWRFRLGAIATQLSLWIAMAAGFGLLTVRSERRNPRGSP